MVDAQIIREWIKKADEDFDFAGSVIEDSSFYAQICFHFHQASEKYLKALIIAWDLEFKKIHDLPVLLKICLKKSTDLEALMDACRFLNGFYIDTRYPVHWPTEYTREDAQEAMKAATEIRSTVKNLLKSFIER